MDQHSAIGQRYGVQGFPTLKIFTPGSSTPTDYNGPRTAVGIAKSAMKSLNAVVRGRLEGKKKSSGKAGGSGDSSASGGNGKVVKVTAGNFEKEVMQTEVPVMIAFAAPWWSVSSAAQAFLCHSSVHPFILSFRPFIHSSLCSSLPAPLPVFPTVATART